MLIRYLLCHMLLCDQQQHNELGFGGIIFGFLIEQLSVFIQFEQSI